VRTDRGVVGWLTIELPGAAALLVVFIFRWIGFLFGGIPNTVIALEYHGLTINNGDL